MQRERPSRTWGRQRQHHQQQQRPWALLLVAAAATIMVASGFVLPATTRTASMARTVGTAAGMMTCRTATALFGKKRRREQDWCVFLGGGGIGRFVGACCTSFFILFE
jgi:hypothetical protein